MSKVKFIFILSCLTNVAQAQLHKGYHLFKPVPRNDMREFALDRPDITESPQTLDAGHFQFEGDVVKWGKANKNSETTVFLWSGLYKIGLTHALDFHVGYELYNINPTIDGVNTKDGPGGLTFRLKGNFWGNDGNTATALGVVPYVTFYSGDPFETKSGFQYGIGFPFSYTLTSTLDLGLQSQLDFVPNEENTHELNAFQSIVLGGTLIGKVDFFVEAIASFLKEDQQFLANIGFIYNVSPNVKVDVAGNVGLTPNSPSRVYLGLSFRI